MTNEIKVEAGKEYFYVACESCGRGIAFAEATQPENTQVELPSELHMTCHACGQSAVYHPRQVQRSQGRYRN